MGSQTGMTRLGIVGLQSFLVCRVRLYCKGADNIIYNLLQPGQALEQYTQPHLAEMARSGLRTLCIAYRDIPTKAYEVWSSSSLTNVGT